MRHILPAVLCVWLTGCRVPLPTYEWQGASSALQTISHRHEELADIAATGRVELTDAEGKTVSLDAVLVARGHTHMRMRAWKFHQAVLDLTLTPDGLYLWTTEQGPASRHADKLNVTARQLRDAWALISGGLLVQTPERVEDEGGESFRVVYSQPPVVATIDRATRTVRSYTIVGESGAAARVDLTDYRIVEGGVWPMRTELHGDLDRRIVVRLHEVQTHQQLPASAFVPPARAVKQP